MTITRRDSIQNMPQCDFILPNHISTKITQFVLSIAEYERLLPDDRPKDLAALRKPFDARLAVRDEPGAGDRLRNAMAALVNPRLGGTSDATTCTELLGGVYVLGRAPSERAGDGQCGKLLSSFGCCLQAECGFPYIQYPSKCYARLFADVLTINAAA